MLLSVAFREIRSAGCRKLGNSRARKSISRELREVETIGNDFLVSSRFHNRNTQWCGHSRAQLGNDTLHHVSKIPVIHTKFTRSSVTIRDGFNLRKSIFLSIPIDGCERRDRQVEYSHFPQRWRSAHSPGEGNFPRSHFLWARRKEILGSNVYRNQFWVSSLGVLCWGRAKCTRHRRDASVESAKYNNNPTTKIETSDLSQFFVSLEPVEVFLRSRYTILQMPHYDTKITVLSDVQ